MFLKQSDKAAMNGPRIQSGEEARNVYKKLLDEELEKKLIDSIV